MNWSCYEECVQNTAPELSEKNNYIRLGMRSYNMRITPGFSVGFPRLYHSQTPVERVPSRTGTPTNHRNLNLSSRLLQIVVGLYPPPHSYRGKNRDDLGRVHVSEFAGAFRYVSDKSSVEPL